MTEPIVTISTGWMFAHGYDTWTDQQPFLDHTDGAELSLVRDTDRFETYEQELPDWAYLSFHLATNLPEYNHIKTLTEDHDPDAAVLHPDEDFSTEMVERYLDKGVPLAFENLDYRLFGGMTIDEVSSVLKEYDLPLVFDVQHAYEHDPSMKYAWALLQKCGDQIVHYHVSGEQVTDGDVLNRHALVQNADNRDEILSFIDAAFTEGYGRPMVIEGKYESPEDVQEEVGLLKEAARGQH